MSIGGFLIKIGSEAPLKRPRSFFWWYFGIGFRILYRKNRRTFTSERVRLYTVAKIAYKMLVSILAYKLFRGEFSSFSLPPMIRLQTPSFQPNEVSGCFGNPIKYKPYHDYRVLKSTCFHFRPLCGFWFEISILSVILVYKLSKKPFKIKFST